MRTSLYANLDLKAKFPCVMVFNLHILNLIRICGLTNFGLQFTLSGSLLYSGFVTCEVQCTPNSHPLLHSQSVSLHSTHNLQWPTSLLAQSFSLPVVYPVTGKIHFVCQPLSVSSTSDVFWRENIVVSNCISHYVHVCVPCVHFCHWCWKPGNIKWRHCLPTMLYFSFFTAWKNSSQRNM